jgi:peptidoglycan/xylan/chitin deacetylase (PgdA/CDA1 family)
LNNYLKKVKFKLHLDPKIEKHENSSLYIPEDKKAVLLIYADFELGWAWRYSKNSKNRLQTSKEHGLTERENVPVIIDICKEYQIPITWATVGHLFLKSCSREKSIAHENLKRLAYFENPFWKYSDGDWFEDDPCTDFRTNPEWYCPDLIQLILNSDVKHEIGCHTFSHIDCTDKICSPEVFDNEISECKKYSEALGINMKSFVHPAHTIGNLDGLIKHGFTSFRTDYNNILGYPKKYKNKLWEFKSTWEFVLFKEWSLKYHIYRYCEILRRAMKSNTVCVLWFHPSMDRRFFESILTKVFEFVNENKDNIWTTNVSDYVSFLEENGL